LATFPAVRYQNQTILLGDRGTRVLTTCPGLHSTAGRLGFEPATYWSQVRHPTAH